MSAPSEPVDFTAPGYGLEARAESDGVRLRWAPAGDGDFASARVLRESRFGAARDRHRARPRVPGQDVDAGSRYRYTVVLLGDDGREALPSERVEVEVPAR